MPACRLCFAAILLILSAAALRADQIDDLVKQGIEALYSVRFDMAAKSFDAAIAADPNDPRGHFFRAAVHLWSYVFDHRPEQLDQFLRHADRAIQVASARDDSRSRLFLGMAYGYKAIANGRARNFSAAAVSGRTCYEKLESLVDDDPAAYDAYLGLGIFHFILGSVPKIGQILGSMSGIKGDAALGLKEIETVVRRGIYFRNDAQLILAFLTIYYKNDLKGGVRMLQGLANRYPQNIVFSYALGSAYLGENLPIQAALCFKKVVDADNHDFRLFTDLGLARLGQCAFLLNDFNSARSYFQAYLRKTEEKAFVAMAWYHIGLCFEMAGNRENGIKAYRRARSASVESPEDFSARRRADIRLKTPLTQTDILLLQAMNSASARQFDAAVIAAVKAMKRKPLNGTQDAQAFYILARAFQEKGDLGRAITSYRLAIEAKENQETWIKPWGYYYMAECYLKIGDQARWKRSLTLARAFHSYDYEPNLRFMIERDVTLID